MAELKRVSKKARFSSWLRWSQCSNTCFTYEHMQTFGYLMSMIPVIDELYESEEDKVRSLRTYTTFFNTEPELGSIIVGLTVRLEEARANGEPIDDDTIVGIKAGLMGPIAGLGDSLIVGTLIPILLGIALGLSTGGNILGPIFYIVAWNLIIQFGMKFAYDQGYALGENAVEALVGPSSAALRSSIVMVGTMVIGAVAATWITITTPLTITFSDTSSLVLQDTLDSIYPGLLNVAFVWLCWWLMTKRKLSATTVMLILVGIAFLGVLVGLFNPQLSY